MDKAAQLVSGRSEICAQANTRQVGPLLLYFLKGFTFVDSKKYQSNV